MSVTYDWTESTAAVNCVVTFLKVFKYLRPIHKLALFTETLRLSSGDMAYMCVIIGIVLLAFGSAFNLAFGPDVFGFTSLGRTILTLFRAMLGDFNLDTLVASNYILGPFLFTLFIFLVFFVILSMFLSIVDESYDAVRTALEDEADKPPPPLEADMVRFRGEVVGVAYAAVRKVSGINLAPQPSKVGPAPEGGEGGEGGGEVAGGAFALPSSPDKGGGSGEGGNAGDRAFARRREEVASEAGPVAKALGGAFAQLDLLGDQQREMLDVLAILDEKLMKRRQKLAGAAEDFNMVDGGDKGRRNKY